MDTPENYYAILGIPIDANEDTLKRAYRQLARRYHPDLAGPGGALEMKRLNRAYAVLSDPEQRPRSVSPPIPPSPLSLCASCDCPRLALYSPAGGDLACTPGMPPRDDCYGATSWSSVQALPIIRSIWPSR